MDWLGYGWIRMLIKGIFFCRIYLVEFSNYMEKYAVGVEGFLTSISVCLNSTLLCWISLRLLLVSLENEDFLKQDHINNVVHSWASVSQPCKDQSPKSKGPLESQSLCNWALTIPCKALPYMVTLGSLWQIVNLDFGKN